MDGVDTNSIRGTNSFSEHDNLELPVDSGYNMASPFFLIVAIDFLPSEKSLHYHFPDKYQTSF
jgi:hypothetical protein